MAFAFLSHVVADLTLGKPALPYLSSSSTVREAISALKLLQVDDVSEISIWDCCHSPPTSSSSSSDTCNSNQHISKCRCIGKVCMPKLVCYLASDQSLQNPAQALRAPVTVLLDGKAESTVQHVDPQASLLEVFELIIAGAQNLVVPIKCHGSKNASQQSPVAHKLGTSKTSVGMASMTLPKTHNGQEYCWLSQEDVLRFIVGSIAVFSPLPMMSIKDLGIIGTDVRMVGFEEDASSALAMIKSACLEMTAVAVVDRADDDHDAVKLVGDISSSTLQTCNETAALALAALSAGDFFVYTQDCRNPPDVLVDLIRLKIFSKVGSIKANPEPILKNVDVNHLLRDLDIWDELSSSSDDESGAESPTGPHDLSQKWVSGHIRALRTGSLTKSRSGPIFCSPNSSLIAVLLQALAHREHYVWVTDEDDILLGIVTFLDILTVMFNHMQI